MFQVVGKADQQKAVKQSRDDSIKQFHNSTLHIFTVKKICRWGCIL